MSASVHWLHNWFLQLYPLKFILEIIFGLIHKITFWKLKFDMQLKRIYSPLSNVKIVSYIFDTHGKELYLFCVSRVGEVRV